MKKLWIFGLVMLFLCSFAFAYNTDIVSYSINPCVGQTWENGTALSISFTPNACPDNTKNYPPSNCSQVTGKASIYLADTNIQVGDAYWLNYYVSGTTFTFDTLKINKTGTYTLRMQAKSDDILDPGSIVDLTFTVAISPYVVNVTNITNVEYGDCVTNGGTLGGVNITGGTDAITKIMDEGKAHGFGYTVMWLVFMLVVAGLIWIGAAEYGMISVGIIAFSEVILLFVGVYLGFISWLIILFIGIIASAIVGKKIYDLFKGGD
jgi:hypothetical protein